MGRLEKQIMIGALALVGVLVAVVILKGLAPREDEPIDPSLGSDWSGNAPALMLGADGQAIVTPPAAVGGEGADPLFVDLGAAPAGATPSTPELAAAPPPGDAGLLADPLAPPAAPVAEPIAAPVDKESYVVRSGDTLGHIAQRELGSVRFTDAILNLNPGINANNLKVGAEIKLPKRSELPALPPKSDAAASASAPVSAPAGASGAMHTVAAGETLWSIAVKYLGDGSRAGEIVAANPDKLKSKDSTLKIGMKLRIPKR